MTNTTGAPLASRSRPGPPWALAGAGFVVVLVATAVAMVAVVATTPTTAAAESTPSVKARRDAVRARHAQLAAQIDVMRASDAQLESAVASLTAQVSLETAGADAARQALGAATDAAAAAGIRLSETRARIAAIHDDLVQRAVSEYVEPDTTLTEVFASRNLDDASRRRQLLSEVNSRSVDALDQMHAARDDLAVQQEQLDRAQALAAERRRQADAQVALLGAALGAKDRMVSALQVRMAAFQAEADATAAQDANLSALIRARQVAAYAFPGGRRASGKVSGAGLIWPASGPVTSPFGFRWGRLHTGIDIGAPFGSPIRAAKAGHVIFSGQMGGYGNVVVIYHGGGFSTLYAHESSLVTADGADVAQGQVIGYCGATGDATGPHLHFETRVDGTAQDPMRFLA